MEEMQLVTGYTFEEEIIARMRANASDEDTVTLINAAEALLRLHSAVRFDNADGITCAVDFGHPWPCQTRAALRSAFLYPGPQFRVPRFVRDAVAATRETPPGY